MFEWEIRPATDRFLYHHPARRKSH